MSLPKRARGVLSRSGKKRGVSHDVGTFHTLAGTRFSFIIADSARARGIYNKGCRCGERLRAKAGGSESLTQVWNRSLR